jgi:hypothetical protein
MSGYFTDLKEDDNAYSEAVEVQLPKETMYFGEDFGQVAQQSTENQEVTNVTATESDAPYDPEKYKWNHKFQTALEVRLGSSWVC